MKFLLLVSSSHLQTSRCWSSQNWRLEAFSNHKYWKRTTSHVFVVVFIIWLIGQSTPSNHRCSLYIRCGYNHVFPLYSFSVQFSVNHDVISVGWNANMIVGFGENMSTSITKFRISSPSRHFDFYFLNGQETIENFWHGGFYCWRWNLFAYENRRLMVLYCSGEYIKGLLFIKFICPQNSKKRINISVWICIIYDCNVRAHKSDMDFNILQQLFSNTCNFERLLFRTKLLDICLFLVNMVMYSECSVHWTTMFSTNQWSLPQSTLAGTLFENKRTEKQFSLKGLFSHFPPSIFSHQNITWSSY